MYTVQFRFRAAALVFILLACILSPATASASGTLGAAGNRDGDVFPFLAREVDFAPGLPLPEFARKNLPTFSTFLLSNGIPVIVKKNDANRIQHISLVIRGGSPAADPSLAGLESIALASMARASTTRSYEEIQDLLDETSSGMGASSNFEFSGYTLNTLDKYFDRLFPVWVETIVSPAFHDSDFNQVLSDARLALKSKEQNPWSKTGLVSNAEFFAGHPYSVSPDGTAESLARMTLGDVKSWYAERFTSDRLFVVAVGDFDSDNLMKKLEEKLGSLARRTGPVATAIPARTPPLPGPERSRLVRSEYPQSKGIGYIRGDFPAPPPEDPAFMPLNIAMRMLSDLLFNVMRDKYGATYSPQAFIRSFSANYGSLVVYKTKVAAQAKAYFDEAVASLARGECMSVDPTASDGDEPRMSVEDALPVYKALFKNSYYESQQTNGAIASRIASSVIESGDYRNYLLDTARVDAVNAGDIRSAFGRYVLEGRILWVVLGSKDVIEPVKNEDYSDFAK